MVYSIISIYVHYSRLSLLLKDRSLTSILKLASYFTPQDVRISEHDWKGVGKPQRISEITLLRRLCPKTNAKLRTYKLGPGKG